MASIPCSSRHSITYIKDIQHLFKNQAQHPFASFTSHPIAGLQYFNMRVVQRLHRYRSMKKNWQEVATSVQNVSSSLSPACESPIPIPDILPITQNTTQKPTIEAKAYCINDYINATTSVKDNNDRNLIELDPLHSRIQQDLIKLRKLIKTKQKKFTDNASFKTPTSSRPSGDGTSIGTAVDDQENNNTTIRKTSSLNKLKPLDRVKIAGCQMRPPPFPTSDSVDSGIGSTSNSSSTCSQYSKKQQQQQQQQQKVKRQNNNKTFNIHRSRVNPPPPPPLPSDSFSYRVAHSSKKKSNTSSKIAQNMSLKTPVSSRLPIPKPKTSPVSSRPPIPIPQTPPVSSRLPIPQTPPVVEIKQPSFIKHETPLPPIQRLSDSEDIYSSTHVYTYSASSSSTTPRSMVLKRNTSLLPILLQSCSCIGIQQREDHFKKSEYYLEEEQEENNNDNDYYHLLDYKNLINHLPKPIISIRPRHGQDDYGILFEQLDHIRETMPDSNIYDDYARII